MSDATREANERCYLVSRLEQIERELETLTKRIVALEPEQHAGNPFAHRMATAQGELRGIWEQLENS